MSDDKTKTGPQDRTKINVHRSDTIAKFVRKLNSQVAKAAKPLDDA